MSNLQDASTTFMYAVNDTHDGLNVPTVPLGEMENGKTILMKAVFVDKDSADAVANHMDKQANHPGRFEVVMVELWRPTDIEIYVRNRIRQEKEKENTPKIIIH